MVRILLVRHGHVPGIDPPRYRGQREVALTELGVRQAAAAGARIAAIAKPAEIWTSPMARCVETGSAIAKATGVAAKVNRDLIDLDYGDWTWKTYEEARAADADLFDRWYSAPQTVRFPGGESLQDMVLRTGDALRAAMAFGADQTLVMVTHDSVERALLMQVLDQPLSAYRRIDFSPCGITEIGYDDGKLHVRGVNATEHLEGL